jgi:hypothetical protein
MLLFYHLKAVWLRQLFLCMMIFKMINFNIKDFFYFNSQKI